MKDEEYNEKMYRLEVYNALYKAYADEIRNLWQRSIFLGAFMTLAWGGYGALQLKFITRKCGEFDMATYYIASLGICATIMILSLLWIAMAKGSKFVQEAHERHIEDLGFDKVEKMVAKNCDKRLFCDLGKYDNPPYSDDKNKPMDVKENLFFGGDLKPYRYSPSKINIALGCFSFLLAFLLIITHTIFALSVVAHIIFATSLPILWIHCMCYICYLLIAIAIFVFVIQYRLERIITFKDLKGGKQKDNKKTKGSKNADKL